MASALAATAVLRESTETNAVAQTEIAVIRYFLQLLIKAPRFSSFRIPEQIPSARKQLESGIKTFFDIKFRICAKDNKSVFVENAATVLPDAATMMQNVGIKAYTKSADTDIAAQAEDRVSLIFAIKIRATVMALTVESADAIPELPIVSLKL